jgi:hypothetical protein
MHAVGYLAMYDAKQIFHFAKETMQRRKFVRLSFPATTVVSRLVKKKKIIASYVPQSFKIM